VKAPIIPASRPACSERPRAEEDDSSDPAAFSCVTSFTPAIARFTWSMPFDCSRAAAVMVSTMAETLPTAFTISPSRVATSRACASPAAV